MIIQTFFLHALVTLPSGPFSGLRRPEETLGTMEACAETEGEAIYLGHDSF